MSSTYTILIVEDDTDISNVLRHALESEYDSTGHQRYSVETAIDGCEALCLLSTCQPDLILLDMMMPRMGGADVLGHMKAHALHYPVIVLTASKVGYEVAWSYGNVAHAMMKPFDLYELLDTVAMILSKSETGEMLATLAR